MTSTVPVLEWLQYKQKRDQFSSLKSLSVDLDLGTQIVDDVDEVARFGQSVIVMANFWHLQRCCLDGAFDMTVAALMLPVSLQHLRLFPLTERMPTTLQLSIFERFTSLQSLLIDVCDIDDWLSEEARPHGKQFILNAVLPSLTHLYLGVWPLKLVAGCSVTNCLSSLQHLVAYIKVQEANLFLDMPCLRYLGLVFEKQASAQESCQLVVKKESQLIILAICGSLGDILPIEVRKAGVQLLCRDAIVGFRYAGDCMYKAMDNFPELPFI